jgi:hypothetical protein
LAHQDEVAIVGDKDLAVSVPVLGHLPGSGGDPGVIFGGLHLNRAACGKLARQRLSVGKVLELLSREKAAVRLAGAPVRQLQHTLDLRLQFLADFVQQGSKRMIVRFLLNARPCGANLAQFPEVCLEWRHQ